MPDGTSEPLEMYANDVTIAGSLYEFLFILSTNTPVGQVRDGQPSAIEKKNVVYLRMSPQHAKAMMALLAGNVAGYEQQFGKLPLPPEIQKGLDMYLDSVRR